MVVFRKIGKISRESTPPKIINYMSKKFSLFCKIINFVKPFANACHDIKINKVTDLQKIYPLLICTLFLKNQVRQTEFFQATQAVKIQFEINRLKIQFAELNFSKLIFRKSSTDQQGDSVTKV